MTQLRGSSFGCVLCSAMLLPGLALGQGKMPYESYDEVIYHGRSFHVEFAIYERETVANAPDTGLPQTEWIEESIVTVRSNQAPAVTGADKALALKVARAYCAHYDLTVRQSHKAEWLAEGVWSFADLCWKPGW